MNCFNVYNTVCIMKVICLFAAQEGSMPGFVEYMYKNILPACFLAPLKQTFDLSDGNTFLVSDHMLTCFTLHNYEPAHILGVSV